MEKLLYYYICFNHIIEKATKCTLHLSLEILQTIHDGFI